MATPFIGQISMFGGNFAPRNWAFCNGQLLSIAQNSALFSLLGTTYGGNGTTTFALPDLRGRTPIHAGQGPGLSNRVLGESSGSENVTLIVSQMPSHTHAVTPGASSSAATSENPSGQVPAAGGAYDSAANATLQGVTSGATGGSQPHTNMPPYLVINYIIALQGIFPSRN